MEPREIYLLSSTHWDREWYQTFQGMRFRLVEVLDELLDVMERQPDFELFCMDGQTIVLEDYAAVAPENTERLKKLIQAGRIKIGPWYIMPDERLVSGESIIHNFLRGQKVAADWGADTWKFGYLCDIFGHIGQMPQILKGFGIDGAYLGRGLGAEDWKGGFIWQSPDGSSVMGYFDCYAKFTLDVTYRYGTPEYEAALKAELERHVKLDSTPVLVLADAFDHTPVNPHTQEMLADIQKLYPHAKIRHDSLENLAASLEAYRDQLPVRKNELIDPARDKALSLRAVPSSISSYYPLKMQNDQCQNFLEKLVESMYALARMHDLKARPSFLALAWKYLLQNQPHDSICGCSIDQVHIDMRYRYDQVKEIGSEILDRAAQCLWQQEPQGDSLSLSLFNPFLYDWTAPVRMEIPFSKDFPAVFSEAAGYETRFAFRLYDGNGCELPYQIHRIRRDVTQRTQAQHSRLVDMYDVSVSVPLKALSTAHIRVAPDPHPVRFAGQSMHWGADWCDNGLIRLDIAADGSLTLTDHRTGRAYSGLNRFVDDCDAGNGWFHDKPVNDEQRLPDTVCTVRRTACGPACTTFAIQQTLKLPKSRLDTEKVSMPLETTVTLWAGKPYAELRVTVSNPATDHRLRALFPTGSTSGRYTASQTFHMTERAAGQAEDRLCWDEMDPAEKDTTGILYSRDAQGGLAFVAAEGFHEGGMSEDGVLALTMLRSFSRAFLADEPQACRLIGKHSFRYAIHPLAENDNDASLLHLQEQLAVALPHQLGHAQAGWSKSALRLAQNRLMLSAIKPPEDGETNALVVRLWNPCGEAVEDRLETGFALQSACRISLDERRSEALPAEENGVSICVRPWELLTLKLKAGDAEP